MAVYAIILREGPIHDQAAYDEYLKAGKQDPTKFQITPLAMYGKIEPAEGKPADGAVILQFPSMEAAKEWYYSPGYQARAPHRMRSADYRIMFVEGV